MKPPRCPVCEGEGSSPDATGLSVCGSCGRSIVPDGSLKVPVIIRTDEEGAPAPQSVDLPTVLEGRYVFQSLLGSGTMGCVYAAVQVSTGRRVAVKILTRSDPTLVARFLREARILGSLAHPNVVPVYDGGEVDGHPYLVTELLEGDTLAVRIEKTGRIPVTEAVDIIREVLAGLAACHAKEVIHRDIKPSNILFGVDGHVRLVDFGVARRRSAPSSLTTSGTLLGTPQYLAPECIRGGAFGPGSDVYSVGCVLYEMLTGRPPFVAPNLMALLRMALEREPLPVSRCVACVPEEVSLVVGRALAKRPEDRIATATAFASALERATLRASSAPTGAREAISRAAAPVAPATGPAAGARPGRRLALGAAAGTVAMALVLALAWAPGRPGPPASPSPSASPDGPARPARDGQRLPGTVVGRDGIRMVLIPEGWFMMGSSTGPEHERPVHRVWVDAFYMDETEVPNAKYRVFVRATGRRAPSTFKEATFNDDRQPVVGVTWHDAAAYAAWVRERLPTEAEWEKASRGGVESRRYPWGDAPPKDRDCFGLMMGFGALPIGSYRPNGYGLYNMAGNVWEWCSDWYEPDYYGRSPARNPAGPTTGKLKVRRGGDWENGEDHVGCAIRRHRDPDTFTDNGGIRCVLPAGRLDALR